MKNLAIIFTLLLVALAAPYLIPDPTAPRDPDVAAELVAPFAKDFCDLTIDGTSDEKRQCEGAGQFNPR